ncbi:MAG: SusD/RagB family nutrient-binding outer membrane lipoprotein [Cytophagales bacterium]|nr:SusD/RagB family nutrient-binding outer membrane lipoprotein [Cytophagales bacterium]
MKKILYTSLLFISMGFIHGCKFTEELRTNPISPSDAPINTLLSACELGMGYTKGGNEARFNGMFVQQITGIGRQHFAIGNFIFGQQDTDDAWDNYYRIMFNLKTIISKAGTQSPAYSGIAKVLMAGCLGSLTDLYGDIPYSNALKGSPDNLQPSYDSQQSIYTTIQKLLDEAIVELSASSNVLTPGSDDFIYGGNTSSWTSAAYALKARYYLHLGKVDASNYTSAISALASSGFTSANDFIFPFAGLAQTSQSPFFQFMDQRAGDVALCKTMVDTILAKSDPRLTYYFDTTGTGNDVVGAIPGESDNSANLPGKFVNKEDAPVYFITYTEVKFIEAECKFKTGDLTGAATAYNEAVKASIKLVTSAAAPVVYADKYASETSTTLTLEKIMVQKWLALFLQSESWTDWRRTGLPVFTSPANANTSLNGALPRKWPYPTKERNLNAANVPSEGNLPLLKKVWWDI